MQRKRHGADFKAKVALEAIKGLKTVNELSSEYGVHASQINQWKKQVLDELPGIFSSRRAQGRKDQEELTAQLYQQIGQLKVEVDWLKKNLGFLISGADKFARAPDIKNRWWINDGWWSQIILS